MQPWQLAEPDRVNALSYSPDGKSLVVTSFERIRIFDTSNGELLREINFIGANFRKAALSPGGRFLATHVRNQVYLWDLTRDDRSPLSRQPGGRMAFSHDGSEFFVTGGRRGYLNVWKLPSANAEPE